MVRNVMSFVGLEITPNNHVEKLLSGVGGIVGIFLIALATRWCLVHAHAIESGGAWAAAWGAAVPVVASMGASCVLIFAVPHGALSQPWAVGVGHLVSALVGVVAAKLLGTGVVAGAVAVGAAITAMYYCRAIHPPGGHGR